MLKQLLPARLDNAGSVNWILQHPEKNQSPPILLLQNQRVKRLYYACFCSAFKELIFNSLSFSKTIASWWSGWSAPLHDLHCSSLLGFAWNLERFIYPSVNYQSSGTYWPIRYSVAGLTEGLKTFKSLQTVFSSLAFFPTRPYHPVSPSSLHGQCNLRSQWLNARPSDP